MLHQTLQESQNAMSTFISAQLQLPADFKLLFGLLIMREVLCHRELSCMIMVISRAVCTIIAGKCVPA